MCLKNGIAGHRTQHPFFLLLDFQSHTDIVRAKRIDGIIFTASHSPSLSEASLRAAAFSLQSECTIFVHCQIGGRGFTEHGGAFILFYFCQAICPGF